MRQVVSPYYTPTGNQVTVIDPHALQTELGNLESTSIGIQAALNDLVRKVESLQAQTDATQLFYAYITEHHPAIIDEYRVREAARVKLCPENSLEETVRVMHAHNTLAAVRKLP